MDRRSNTGRYRPIAVFVLLFLTVASSGALAQQGRLTLSGRLLSTGNSRNVGPVPVIAQRDSLEYRTLSDSTGRFIFRALPAGIYTVRVTGLLYISTPKTVHLQKDLQIVLAMEPVKRTLDEVFITASEAKGMTSTSVIDRRAMQHLQPSSFTDLLELLPGGRAVDPNLTAMNQIRLREASGNPLPGYEISSLGTAFLVDGSPVNTTANLQSSAGFFLSDPNSGRNSVNRGVDMRSLSTDQIEKVEIVRGIPSVEYGDLTSGLVKIERKKGASPYTARIKTDGFSKLFALGKGLYLPAQDMSLNMDLGYLNAKDRPIDNFQHYKRINASIRMEKCWTGAQRDLKWNAALDYATNIDNQRTDPDNGFAPIDKYTSRFSGYTLSSSLRNDRSKQNGLLKSWELSGRVNYQRDKLEATKWIQTKAAGIMLNSVTAGERDVKYLPASYASELVIDGQPLNAFFKAMTQLEFHTAAVRHQVKLGLETNYSRNFGKGEIYDLDLPPATTTEARPRAFDTIPGMLNQAFFAEDMLRIRFGDHELMTAVGLRGMSLLGMDKQYAIANKIYLDPRVNMRWALPGIATGAGRLSVTLGAGYGLHTKMPTLDQLYPSWQFEEIVQLNFYHNNPAYRKANTITYIMDRANYELRASVNRKLEFNGDFSLNGNRLSLTYFSEKLSSGFRPVNGHRVLSYRQYDISSVDAGNLTAPPATSDFAYEMAKRFYGIGYTENGSTLEKKGIEFQFASKRLKGINTRFTVNGAWFHTTYVNTYPLEQLIPQNAITNGNYHQYVGIYDEKDGYWRERLNTNLIADSYLPSLGLIISASVQSTWFYADQKMFTSGTPVQYIDINEAVHPYTEESRQDPDLARLSKDHSPSVFRRRVEPVDLQVNLKVTKEFKKKVAIAMFVNRLFTYAPDYISNGVLWKRSGLSSPYFGMELNFNL